jgi:hypothetical protein
MANKNASGYSNWDLPTNPEETTKKAEAPRNVRNGVGSTRKQRQAERLARATVVKEPAPTPKPAKQTTAPPKSTIGPTPEPAKGGGNLGPLANQPAAKAPVSIDPLTNQPRVSTPSTPSVRDPLTNQTPAQKVQAATNSALGPTPEPYRPTPTPKPVAQTQPKPGIGATVKGFLASGAVPTYAAGIATAIDASQNPAHTGASDAEIARLAEEDPVRAQLTFGKDRIAQAFSKPLPKTDGAKPGPTVVNVSQYEPRKLAAPKPEAPKPEPEAPQAYKYEEQVKKLLDKGGKWNEPDDIAPIPGTSSIIQQLPNGATRQTVPGKGWMEMERPMPRYNSTDRQNRAEDIRRATTDYKNPTWLPPIDKPEYVKAGTRNEGRVVSAEEFGKLPPGAPRPVENAGRFANALGITPEAFSGQIWGGARTDAEAERNLIAKREQDQAVDYEVSRINKAIDSLRDTRATARGVSRDVSDQIDRVTVPLARNEGPYGLMQQAVQRFAKSNQTQADKVILESQLEIAKQQIAEQGQRGQQNTTLETTRMAQAGQDRRAAFEADQRAREAAFNRLGEGWTALRDTFKEPEDRQRFMAFAASNTLRALLPSMGYDSPEKITQIMTNPTGAQLNQIMEAYTQWNNRSDGVFGIGADNVDSVGRKLATGIQ